MLRGSRPGERRGGRKQGTPNRRTILRDRILSIGLDQPAASRRAFIRKLANDLLQSRDPRTEIGLEAWGQLLETQYGHTLAAAVIKKSFGARELTPEWFKARLLSGNNNAFNFAKNLLPQIHPFQKLGPAFFTDLIDSLSETSGAAAYNVPLTSDWPADLRPALAEAAGDATLLAQVKPLQYLGFFASDD